MPDLCAHCGRWFGSPADLLTHAKKAHPDGGGAETLATNPASRTPGVTCSLCGRDFRTAKELAAHALRPHAGLPRAGRPWSTGNAD
jgi:uncharacterized C2H2 Zn-finger protein